MMAHCCMCVMKRQGGGGVVGGAWGRQRSQGPCQGEGVLVGAGGRCFAAAHLTEAESKLHSTHHDGAMEHSSNAQFTCDSVEAGNGCVAGWVGGVGHIIYVQEHLQPLLLGFRPCSM